MIWYNYEKTGKPGTKLGMECSYKCMQKYTFHKSTGIARNHCNFLTQNPNPNSIRILPFYNSLVVQKIRFNIKTIMFIVKSQVWILLSLWNTPHFLWMLQLLQNNRIHLLPLSPENTITCQISHPKYSPWSMWLLFNRVSWRHITPVLHWFNVPSTPALQHQPVQPYHQHIGPAWFNSGY